MLRLKHPAYGYAFLGPALIGISLFLLLPIVIVIILSFMSWDLIGTREFIGLDNYVRLADDGPFLNSLVVTALFAIFTVPLSIALGLVLSVFLIRAVPGSSALRVLVVVPWVCAPLALGIVWKWIYQPTDGALNALIGTRIEWLSDPNLALPAVALVTVWSSVGYISLFFQAGLQQIPTTLGEAAELDGAGPLRRLFSITLPLLRPTTFFVSVTTMVANFQVFDTVYAMTGGGPQGRTDVIASRIFNEAFTSFRLGRAAAMAVVLFVALVIFTLIQQRWFSRRITYDMS